MPTVKEAIRTFIDTRIAGRRAAATIAWYGHMLNPFGERYNWQLEQVKTKDVTKWLIDASEGKAESTAVDKHRALATFWKWAADVYNIGNPMRGIPKPGQPKMEPKAIRIEVLDQILKQCTDDVIGHRNRAILLLMADAGLRASEVVQLNLNDVKSRMISVRKGKTRSSTRKSPFGTVTEAAICQWLQDHPGHTTALFCSLGSAERLPQRLTYWGLREMLDRLAERADVGKEIHNLHSLRHFAGQQYAAQGGSLGAIQRNLGHSSATTTIDFYLNHAPDERAAMHDQYSPLNKLK